MRYCLNKTSSLLALRLVWPDCSHGSVGHNPLAGVQHKRGRRPYGRRGPGTVALGVSPRQGSGHAPLDVLPRCCGPRLPREGLLLSPLRDPPAGAVVRDWVCSPWLALAELRLPRGFPAKRHRPARLSEGIARALATDHTMPGADIAAHEQIEPPALIGTGPVKGVTSLVAAQHLRRWCGHLPPIKKRPTGRFGDKS